MESYAAKSLRRTAFRLLLIQGALIGVVAVAFGLGRGWPQAVAVAFGGGIALLNTFISAQRLARSAEVGAVSPNRGMAELYIGAVLRFVGTPALVAAGILVLGLDPLAIIVGFTVAQLGYFIKARAA